MAEQEPLKNAMDTAEGMHQVEGAADDLSGKLLGQVEEVKGMLGELKSEIDKTVSDAATGTGERQQSVEDKIVEGKEKLDVVTGEVGGTVSKAVSDLKELGNKTGEKVSERLEEASDRAVEFIEDAKKAVSEKAGEFGEVGKEVGEELSKVLSKGKDKTNEYARDVAGAVSETTNELEEFGKEANNKVSETWDKGNEKMDELAKQTVEKMAELKKEVDEKIAGAVEEGKEKLKGFTEKADEKVDEIKENVVGSEKGVQDSSEETEGLTGKSHYGQTENEPDAGQKLEKQEHLGGIDLTGIGETLKGAVEDISEKISEKINEAQEFSEEKLHDADKEHSQKTEEVHDSQGYFRSVDSSAIGDGVKNITEDVSKKVSSKVNVAKEFLEGQLHDEDKGHGQKPSEEAHDKQGYVSGMDFASVGSGLKAMAEDISGKFAERINEGREFLEEKLHDESNLTKEVSEKLKDEKEFQEEKVCGAGDEGKQIVHEHMGGIYVKGDTGARDGEFQEEIPKDSHLDRKIDEEREASEHDFLGAADFGGLQSTMKDVFNKGAEKVKEVAEEMLPDSAEHHEEPKVIKKILPAGEDVPEQVGTLSESGVYYDDYEPEKTEGSRSSKLEDFVSGKVKDVDKMLEQALNIDKKPNAPEATEIISVEQDDGKQKDTEFAAAADEVRETFEKVVANQFCVVCETRQFPDSTVDLDNSEMESGDNRAEKEQTAEERRHSASGSPRQSPTTKQTEAEQTAIVDNADNEPLTGFTDQAAPPVPEHQELSDVLSSATKHAEEKGVANVNEALTSVPEHPISENVPTASESPVLQDTLKFSTAPLVHENAPQPTVQPTAHVQDEEVTKTEIKPLQEKTIEQGSEKLVQETVSVKISEEETKAKEEAAPRDESGASEVTDDQKPVKPSTKKAEEKHEMTEKSVPESQNVEVTSSAPVQQPEAKNVETHPVKSTAESKSQEAASEKSKTDTLKSKSVDAQQQQQQQPARRRCTIL